MVQWPTIIKTSPTPRRLSIHVSRPREIMFCLVSTIISPFYVCIRLHKLSIQPLGKEFQSHHIILAMRQRLCKDFREALSENRGKTFHQLIYCNHTRGNTAAVPKFIQIAQVLQIVPLILGGINNILEA